MARTPPLLLILILSATPWHALPGATRSTQGDPAAEGPHAVETLAFPDLVDPQRNRNVPIKIHLPQGAGPFPIVVVSHGAGGNWDANYAQAHHLASHGYLVMAVEHVGSNTQVLKRSWRFLANLKAMTRDPAEVLSRPRDITFALDQAQAWHRTHERLRGRFDLERIGMLGHSYGAYTTLVSCGMRPAIDWLEPPPTPGTGLGPRRRDERVRCGVALSPQGPGAPFFHAASYASLATPLLGISGSRDRQQGAPPDNRRRAFELWPPGGKFLLWLANADHCAFSDPTGSGRWGLPSPSRCDAQPLCRAATLFFFNAHLRGETGGLDRLSAAGLKPYLRGVVDHVEVMRK